MNQVIGSLLSHRTSWLLRPDPFTEDALETILKAERTRRALGTASQRTSGGARQTARIRIAKGGETLR